MMLRVLLHGYFTRKSGFFFQYDSKQSHSAAEHWTAVTVWGIVWAANPLRFWQWLPMSSREHEGLSSRSPHNQTGKWSRRENQPCHPLQGPRWVLGTREIPWGSSEEHETAFTTHLFWDGWGMILHGYPFPSSAGRKQSKACGHSHRRWWLRVWREISLLPFSFST